MKNQKHYKKQREAITNDSQRKELFKTLFELYSNAMPVVLKTKNNKVMCSFSDEVEALADNLREQIRLRDNQVFEAMSLGVVKEITKEEFAANEIKAFCEYVMHPDSDLHKDAEWWIRERLQADDVTQQ